MRNDRIASGVFFALGLVIAREGLRLPYMSGLSPGAGFFPLWLGIGLMVLSVALFLTTKSANEPFIESLPGFRKAGLVAVAFFVYIFILPYLGLLVALALLLAFLIGQVEKAGWRFAGLVSVLGSGVSYLLFEVWLKVPLPSGLLGI